MTESAQQQQQQRIFERLSQAVVDMDETLAEKIATMIVHEGLDCTKAIETGLGEGMARVGKLYETGEYFIPDLLVCADALQKASDILKTGLYQYPLSKGRVVIGTIYGDTHDLGKNIVTLFMTSAGYEVLDLGKDVPARLFVDEAVKWNADIIAISTLMTTTMKNIKDVIDLLVTEKKREQFWVMLGGKPISYNFAAKIGADGYAQNAVQAVKFLDNTISKLRRY
ncbi:MAG: cobalamin-dependent protein [Planctomycetaceae bacterium]|jgi:methanogenic corrinoid protein MtbC1|nr:cobalamin-dependent protein [Planctomycetaceae bacterium]